MRPQVWGWNARSPASSEWIAVEFAQGQLGSPISDSQIDAFCAYAVARVKTVWPQIPLAFIHHSQLASGRADGKTDIYPNDQPDQQQAFIERILTRLQRLW